MAVAVVVLKMELAQAAPAALAVAARTQAVLAARELLDRVKTVALARLQAETAAVAAVLWLRVTAQTTEHFHAAEVMVRHQALLALQLLALVAVVAEA